MPTPITDLFDFRVQVINCIKRDGYADSAACALALRFPLSIAAAFNARLSPESVAADIIRLDERDEDTPIVTYAERREAVLDAIETAMEEGR